VFDENLSVLVRRTGLLQQRILDGKFGYGRNSDSEVMFTMRIDAQRTPGGHIILTA
jgi:hypothetical protein